RSLRQALRRGGFLQSGRPPAGGERPGGPGGRPVGGLIPPISARNARCLARPPFPPENKSRSSPTMERISLTGASQPRWATDGVAALGEGGVWEGGRGGGAGARQGPSLYFCNVSRAAGFAASTWGNRTIGRRFARSSTASASWISTLRRSAIAASAPIRSKNA